jgi:hypothetical protein
MWRNELNKNIGQFLQGVGEMSFTNNSTTNPCGVASPRQTSGRADTKSAGHRIGFSTRRPFPDQTKPQTVRLNKSPHIVHALTYRHRLARDMISSALPRDKKNPKGERG